MAGSIGFSGSDADKKVEKLSGGEKARLMLGLATFGGPHLLILDEPTNHLDIDSRAALIEAINDYPGAVILVSHDRHLLDACADRLWLVADGKVTPFDGDLDDYRRRVLSDRDDSGDERRAERAPSRRAIPTAQERGRAARRRQAAAPARRSAPRPRSTRLTREIEKLDAALADGELFARDPAKAAALAKARADTPHALAQGRRGLACRRRRARGARLAEARAGAERFGRSCSRRFGWRASAALPASSAAFGGGGSGPRSIDVSRPSAKR